MTVNDVEWKATAVISTGKRVKAAAIMKQWTIKANIETLISQGCPVTYYCLTGINQCLLKKSNNFHFHQSCVLSYNCYTVMAGAIVRIQAFALFPSTKQPLESGCGCLYVPHSCSLNHAVVAMKHVVISLFEMWASCVACEFKPVRCAACWQRCGLFYTRLLHCYVCVPSTLYVDVSARLRSTWYLTCSNTGIYNVYSMSSRSFLLHVIEVSDC